MRRTALQRIQRFFAVISFVAFLGIALIVARVAGLSMPWESAITRQGLVLDLFDQKVALINGHAGHDSGAICTADDGSVRLTEAEINDEITQRTAALLRQAGLDVTILEEYDPRLQNLQAGVLLSLHADSCIEATGYKAAHHAASAIPEIEARILDCIDRHYADATGLSHHTDSVTHDMTEYHAFLRVHPATPAAILELGFLGGDRELLTEESDRVARGVADSILCFLNDSLDDSLNDPLDDPPATPTAESP